MISQENRNAICPESTLESANRRGFIRRAALGTTAIAIGGTLLGKGVIPESSARSDSCAISIFAKCNFVACYDMVLDVKNQNNGTLPKCHLFSYESSSADPLHALTFGSVPLACECHELYGFSGEGIASARTCGAPNKSGLDFYTNFTKRVSITNCGNVGVGPGSCTPNVTLCVRGTGAFGDCVVVDGDGSNCGSGIAPGGVVFGGGGSGEGISSARVCCVATPNLYGIDFYTAKSKRMSITNSGRVGIGTCSPNVTLCVRGTGAFGDCVIINGDNNNTGSGIVPGLLFGGGCSTEGISSERTCNSCFPKGLDFYTDSKKRMVISNCGYVNIYGTVNVCGGFGAHGGITGTTSQPCVPAITGSTCSGVGVLGFSKVIGVEGIAGGSGAIPIVAIGACGQTANLQQWEGHCGTVYAVINKAGSLGLGGVTKPHHVLCISGKAHASSGFSIGPCTCINTTLVVNGSIAAKTRCVSTTSCLATTDYGIFASGAITLTLPPAKTQKGMMLFIKNASTSTVAIKPGGTDTIEGAKSCSPKSLPKQYDSLQLISNGSNEWYILSGAKCGAFVS